MAVSDSDFRAKTIGLLSAARNKWENRKIAINANDKTIAINVCNEINRILEEIKNIT